MENENLILQISDLHFQYPASDFKIEISNIKITQGSKIAISGKSGSGKTTLIHLISGILKPQSGEILFFDKSITDMNDNDIRKHRISNIGFIFQEFELLDYLNVMDNLVLPYKINKSLSLDEEIKDKAKDLAASTSIRANLVADKNIRSVNYNIDVVNGATHYHTTAIMPYWADSLRVVKRVGDHIFYK